MKDKVPFYNIVNMFFVGAVFCIGMVVLFIDKICIEPKYVEIAREWSVMTSALCIIVMYEIGFILNRLSSILIETVLVKTKLWSRASYSINVSEISETNSKFQSMITEINLMRSHILLYTVFAVVSAILGRWWMVVISVLLVAIFVFGGKKHNTKINKILEDYAKEKKYQQQMKDLLNYTEETAIQAVKQE